MLSVREEMDVVKVEKPDTVWNWHRNNSNSMMDFIMSNTFAFDKVVLFILLSAELTPPAVEEKDTTTLNIIFV